MFRLVTVLFFVLLAPVYPVFAEECSSSQYKLLVTDGKSADESRDWGRSVDIYSRMLADCRALIKTDDLAKAYDALAVGQMMLESYSAAIESTRMCLEQEPRCNSCMMTAAKAYEGLGDRNMALEYARSAAAVEPYDEYSAAVGILARDYLKRLDKK